MKKDHEDSRGYMETYLYFKIQYVKFFIYTKTRDLIYICYHIIKIAIVCNNLFVKRRRDIYPLNYRGSTLTELGKNTLTCCFGSAAGTENQVSCSKQVTYILNQEDSCIWLITLHVFDWAMQTHCFWWFSLSGYFSDSLLLAWLELE